MSSPRSIALALGLASMLPAAPTWKAPATLPFGQLVDLELREENPALPPPPRPGDERLGSLLVRAVEPLPDGRGWRLRVLALRTGTFRIPPQDLGEGQKTPELRLTVPRSTPFGAPWMGLGGGKADLLPRLGFPWLWSSLLLLPLLALAAALAHRWRRGAARRQLKRTRQSFQHAWPPRRGDRASLDLGHQAGRDLLVQRFGPEALSWGAADFEAKRLEAWSRWVRSLDAARFGQSDPPFPEFEALWRELEVRP